MHWYAVYTKPRQEDIVTRYLERAGIEVFNPKLKQRKYMQGCYRDVIVPMFPCYIFARFEPSIAFHMIKYTRGVRRIVGGDQPWRVPDEIIWLIKTQEEDGIITIRPQDFKNGDIVAIKDGPLQGLSGIFEKEISGEERVVLLLTAIEYQARIIIDRTLLMKVA